MHSIKPINPQHDHMQVLFLDPLRVPKAPHPLAKSKVCFQDGLHAPPCSTINQCFSAGVLRHSTQLKAENFCTKWI